jgi:outer membrane receptor protein involved in Fe transport
MKKLLCLSGMLALVCALAPAAVAQETRGSIEGIVKDASGAVLPGVTVEARGPALATGQTTVTDGEGAYRFPALPPGIYEVTANLSGFQPAKVANIELQLGRILKVDFSLKLGGVAETVEVTGTPPVIDVKQNAATVSIDKELIDRIPRGRDFTSVITTAPGTNDETKAGGLQVDGASGAENRFVIDGLDTTSLTSGQSQKELLVDFVDEVQVKSSGYNAEYRATTGGVISAITKSGTNAYRGDAGWYYSNSDWSGAERPSLRLNPSNQTLAEYITTRRDPSYSSDMVVDIGGPIVPDRVWFFAGYAPQISRAKRTVTFQSTKETKSFRNDSTDHNINYNVTTQLLRSLRLKFAASNERGIGAPSTLPGKEPDGTSTSNPTLFPNPLSHNTSNDSYATDLAWIVTPKFFVNTNVGLLTYNTWGVTATQFSDVLRHTFSGSNVCADPGRPGTSACPFPEIPSSLQNINSFADNPASTRDVRDKFGRVGVNVDGTYYGTFKGQHTFKTGIQFERLTNDVLTGAQAPTVALSWNASRTTLDDPPRQVRGTYGYYTVSRFFTQGNIHSNNIGLFIQDAWTLNNRLTINAGVRADSETMPSYRPENPSLKFGFGDKIAPRVGFALDVNGDGRWKTYGSWGQFYDISKLELPRGAWGAEHWIDYHYTLDTFNWPSITCTGEPGSGCPGTFIEQADRRHVSNDPNDPLVDPNLKPIRTQEFTLGVDHELNHLMSVGVRYAHKWLDRTIEDVGIQVAGVGEVFMIANPGFGVASKTLLNSTPPCTTCPAQPPAKRDYDGLEFRLRKRLANNWSLNTSYTYSRIYGNYSGLASSDENGRSDPSVERFFDGLYMSFDQKGNPVYGVLGTDRPHYFKAQATYQLPWGTGIGVNYDLASGTPQSSTITFKSVPFFPYGRGDMGRTPVFSNTDLSIYHRLRLHGRSELVLYLNVFNLFDQDTVTRLATSRYRDQLPGLTDSSFFQGFDEAAIVAANGKVRPDPRFGLADQFRGARSMRVQAKISF